MKTGPEATSRQGGQPFATKFAPMRDPYPRAQGREGW
jgi:hypothetical protein